MLGEYDAGYENCIDSMVRQMEDMQFRIDCLHRKNAKLRELVREAIYARDDADWASIVSTAIELGVEADG